MGRKDLAGQSAPSKDGPILIEEGAFFAKVIFHRPEVRNAINVEMWGQLPGIMKDLISRPSVKVVIFTGSGGKAFASGADISELGSFTDPEKARAYYGLLEEALDQIDACPLPTIAMIDGYALGGGFEVALACDLRVASTRSALGVPAARIGAAVDLKSLIRLVRLVGPASAKELLFTGKPMDAQKAFRIGLVNEVVDPEALEAFVLKLAQGIAENAPLSVATSKRIINKLSDLLSPTLLEEATALFISCFESKDFCEGVQAFLEKRKPRFIGR